MQLTKQEKQNALRNALKRAILYNTPICLSIQYYLWKNTIPRPLCDEIRKYFEMLEFKPKDVETIGPWFSNDLLGRIHRVWACLKLIIKHS